MGESEKKIWKKSIVHDELSRLSENEKNERRSAILLIRKMKRHDLKLLRRRQFFTELTSVPQIDRRLRLYVTFFGFFPVVVKRFVVFVNFSTPRRSKGKWVVNVAGSCVPRVLYRLQCVFVTSSQTRL